MKHYYLFILLTLFPLMASADDSGSCGNSVTWTYVESTHKLIISGSGPMNDYGEIQVSENEVRMTHVKTPWNSYKKDIQVVEISEGVTSIGTDSFNGCEALVSVVIANSVTTIGGLAFYECSGLTSLTIPNGVISIGYAAFTS